MVIRPAVSSSVTVNVCCAASAPAVARMLTLRVPSTVPLLIVVIVNWAVVKCAATVTTLGICKAEGSDEVITTVRAEVIFPPRVMVAVNCSFASLTVVFESDREMVADCTFINASNWQIRNRDFQSILVVRVTDLPHVCDTGCRLSFITKLRSLQTE